MKTKATDGAAATVAAIDWVAPDIKPSSEWTDQPNDHSRGKLPFHHRAPATWLPSMKRFADMRYQKAVELDRMEAF